MRIDTGGTESIRADLLIHLVEEMMWLHMPLLNRLDPFHQKIWARGVTQIRKELYEL